jgi:hypothetical protein
MVGRGLPLLAKSWVGGLISRLRHLWFRLSTSMQDPMGNQKRMAVPPEVSSSREYITHVDRHP